MLFRVIYANARIYEIVVFDLNHSNITNFDTIYAESCDAKMIGKGRDLLLLGHLILILADRNRIR
jgi:hypothetical protein